MKPVEDVTGSKDNIGRSNNRYGAGGQRGRKLGSALRIFEGGNSGCDYGKSVSIPARGGGLTLSSFQ